MTRFPDQEWAASWATTSARERSPARRVGVTKVRQGFLGKMMKKMMVCKLGDKNDKVSSTHS